MATAILQDQSENLSIDMAEMHKKMILEIDDNEVYINGSDSKSAFLGGLSCRKYKGC